MPPIDASWRDFSISSDLILTQILFHRNHRYRPHFRLTLRKITDRTEPQCFLSHCFAKMRRGRSVRCLASFLICRILLSISHYCVQLFSRLFRHRILFLPVRNRPALHTLFQKRFFYTHGFSKSHHSLRFALEELTDALAALTSKDNRHCQRNARDRGEILVAKTASAAVT